MKASGGQKHTIQRDSRSARSMLTALCNERTGCVDRPGAAGRISYDAWFFMQSVNPHWVLAVCHFRPRLCGACKRGSGLLRTLVSILTVLNTETALYTAQDALVQARFAQMQALVSLFGALGGGWQQESVK